MNADQETEQKQLVTALEVFHHVIQRHPEFIFRFFHQLLLLEPQFTKQIQTSLDHVTKQTTVDMLKTFALFKPRSSGDYHQKAQLTIQTINQTFPFLSSLAQTTCRKKIEIKNIEDFPQSCEDKYAASELKNYFDMHGSDKSNYHNYHHVYGPILRNRKEVKSLLEIGLGTNNLDVVSNMGAAGRPGASLRAFRDFLEIADIYGADIDKRILFREERIKTFYVDQTDPLSFAEIDHAVPSDLDLLIDDGLHSPNANIQTLKFGLTKIKVNGWVVIEDIGTDAVPVWEVVSALLPSEFESHILSAVGDVVVFAVKRLR